MMAKSKSSDPALSELGRLGAAARNKAMSPEARREQARRAANRRWGNKEEPAPAAAEEPVGPMDRDTMGKLLARILSELKAGPVLDWEDPIFKQMRSLVASQAARRRVHHVGGPGRPKGTKNKEGHRAGRPRKEVSK